MVTEEKTISVPKNDLKWCAVSLSDVIAAGMRLEAAVFNIEGKQARKTIENCRYKYKQLCGSDGIATAYVGGRFKRIWLKKSILPIYQPSTIMDIKPRPDGYLSHITNTNIDELRVAKGQILMTCSGTIGKTALVSNTLNNQIFSHDLIRINCNNQNETGYVYAYLSSKTGNTILATNKYGSVIQHIEPEHLTDIPVPNPPEEIKKHINDLIIRSFELRDKSNDLIDKATELLISTLKLSPIEEIKAKRFDEKREVNNFNVKLSDVDNRFDASYHAPIANAITKHLKENAAELTNVGDKRVSKNIVLPGRFKRVYVEEGQGRVFFGGKQIYELDPSNKKYLSTSKHSARIKAELGITENTILITRSGTVGKVTITPKHWEHWVASDHIIRIFPNENIAGYLSIFLSSDYGHCLIKKFVYGSVVDEIDDIHVSQIPFPFLKDKAIQTEINNLALEANKLRYEAYLLEQRAIKSVEEDVIFA